MPKPAVVLLSGGLDSAVALAIARTEGFAAHALSFRYGQRHSLEVERAGGIARALGAVRHEVVDFDLRPIGASALTGAGDPARRRGVVGDSLHRERQEDHVRAMALQGYRAGNCRG
jgi:7-cyano-7-deazaguanine synthase